jgi:glycosyltransferase involved in cell wall biosynthesis
MKVALVGNFWYRRGGLERVMLADAAGLESRGHSVAPFASAHPLNDPTPYAHHFPAGVDHGALGRDLGLVGRIKAAVRLIHNGPAVAAFDRFLSDVRPDIVHQHGTSRQLSPSILALAKSRGIPTVMKLADHGLRCPSAVMSRPGEPVCVRQSCAGHRYDRAIRFKCVHGSRAASTVAAVELLVNRALHRYERNVDLFLVPSQYLLRRMLETGLPSDRLRVEPNPIEPPDAPPAPLGSTIVAYGRLVDYKGFAYVIEAARSLTDVHFVIAGDGPERTALERSAAGLPNIVFTGSVVGPALDSLLLRARAVVVPSIVPEGFGMVVLEAWRARRPVIVTNRGALPEVVEHGRTGLVVEGNDVESVVRAVRTLHADVDLATTLATNGFTEVQTTYSMSAHLNRLEGIYQELVG